MKCNFPSVKLGPFLKTNLRAQMVRSDQNMITTPNHGLNLLRCSKILDPFALKLMSLHKYKLYQKKKLSLLKNALFKRPMNTF